jgi:hypothetical protein
VQGVRHFSIVSFTPAEICIVAEPDSLQTVDSQEEVSRQLLESYRTGQRFTLAAQTTSGNPFSPGQPWPSAGSTLVPVKVVDAQRERGTRTGASDDTGRARQYQDTNSMGVLLCGPPPPIDSTTRMLSLEIHQTEYPELGLLALWKCTDPRVVDGLSCSPVRDC